MAYKTKLEVVTKIERDLDLEEEEFIQPDEMTSYINDAIAIVEAHINSLGLKDQYLKSRYTLDIVSGTADYALPTNIYENKIKEVVYSNGATIYNIKPLTGRGAAEAIANVSLYGTSDEYRYRIRNDSSTANYFQLIPAARTTENDKIIIEYYRDLERVSADADKVEVPEIALQWLYQYIRTQVYEKETHDNYPASLIKLQKLEELMLSTLGGQLADDNESLLEMDASAYEEMS